MKECGRSTATGGPCVREAVHSPPCQGHTRFVTDPEERLTPELLGGMRAIEAEMQRMDAAVDLESEREGSEPPERFVRRRFAEVVIAAVVAARGGTEDELREALEFYANPTWWDGAAEVIWADSGTRARAALAARAASTPPKPRAWPLW